MNAGDIIITIILGGVAGFLYVTGIEKWLPAALRRVKSLFDADARFRKRMARTRAKRKAVYDAAEEARRQLSQNRMLRRQEARNEWLERWSELGASVHELKAGFTAWEGRRLETTCYIGADGGRIEQFVVVGRVPGADGHSNVVGLTEHQRQHLYEHCSKCKSVKEQAKKVASKVRDVIEEKVEEDMVAVHALWDRKLKKATGSKSFSNHKGEVITIPYYNYRS